MGAIRQIDRVGESKTVQVLPYCGCEDDGLYLVNPESGTKRESGSPEETTDMVNTFIEGTFRQTNLTNESPEYLGRREELRLAEIELMRQRERVAELRRHLPHGPALKDYEFIEGPDDLDSGDAPTRTV